MMKQPIYYEINEELAREAHNMMSFSDYRMGSKTAAYKAYVDDAYELANKVATERPDAADRVFTIADRYAKRLADNMNQASRIGTMAPSILISGASNFPVRKKEKQNEAADRNMQEFQAIQGMLDTMESIERGKNIIKSGDSDAIQKLETRVQKLTRAQELMKATNAYYRKHKTIEGFEGLTDPVFEDIKQDLYSKGKPFADWALSLNRQALRTAEKRLQELKAAKERGNTETETEFFKAVRNTDIMRLQLIFDDKPDEDTRAILKSRGFKWSPSNGAWQRQLTSNAEYALRHVIADLKKMQNE